MSNNLSPQLKVPKAGKVVTYRLIGAGQKDPLTGRPMFRSAFILPGMATIYDPGDEQGNYNKTIRNISGHTTDAAGKVQYQVDEIAFDHTNTISVRPEQYALYEFLERHPRNASNAYHDKTKAPLFERLDLAAMAEKAMEEEDKLWEAGQLARTMDIDDLVDYARTLHVDVNRDPKEIRYAMIQKAKEDPVKFVANSNSIATKTRSRLALAQEEGVIIWQAASRSWNFKGGDGPFMTVSPGEPHFDALADYVLKTRDGELVLKTIERKLGLEPAKVETSSILSAPKAAVADTDRKVPTRSAAKKPTASKGKASKPKAKAADTKPAAGSTESTGSTEGTEA